MLRASNLWQITNQKAMISRKITLKDALHVLISEYGSLETAERYKSIFEDFDQDIYGKAVFHLDSFLQELIEIENAQHLETSNITLSEAVQSFRAIPKEHQGNPRRTQEN